MRIIIINLSLLYFSLVRSLALNCLYFFPSFFAKCFFFLLLLTRSFLLHLALHLLLLYHTLTLAFTQIYRLIHILLIFGVHIPLEFIGLFHYGRRRHCRQPTATIIVLPIGTHTECRVSSAHHPNERKWIKTHIFVVVLQINDGDDDDNGTRHSVVCKCWAHYKNSTQVNRAPSEIKMKNTERPRDRKSEREKSNGAWRQRLIITWLGYMYRNYRTNKKTIEPRWMNIPLYLITWVCVSIVKKHTSKK